MGARAGNVLIARPQHLVLCISERTLLPVIVTAESAGTLPARLVEALSAVLAALYIPAASTQAECDHMHEHRIGRAASKRVLISLNELMFLPEHGLHDRPERSQLEHAL